MLKSFGRLLFGGALFFYFILISAAGILHSESKKSFTAIILEAFI